MELLPEAARHFRRGDQEEGLSLIGLAVTGELSPECKHEIERLLVIVEAALARAASADLDAIDDALEQISGNRAAGQLTFGLVLGGKTLALDAFDEVIAAVTDLISATDRADRLEIQGVIETTSPGFDGREWRAHARMGIRSYSAHFILTGRESVATPEGNVPLGRGPTEDEILRALSVAAHDHFASGRRDAEILVTCRHVYEAAGQVV